MTTSLLVALLVAVGPQPDQPPCSGGAVAADEASTSTRLFFGPTGRALERGEVYVSFHEMMLPFVQVGVTDRFSIGAGAPLPIMWGLDVPIWVTPKLQVINGRNTQASIGVLHFLNVGDLGFGIAYGVVTKGTRDRAVSAGLGYAYADLGRGGGSPVVMLGGERRVAKRMKLLTENYLYRDGGLVTGGVRLFGRHLSVDLAAASFVVDGDRVVFPITNLAWRF